MSRRVGTARRVDTARWSRRRLAAVAVVTVVVVVAALAAVAVPTDGSRDGGGSVLSRLREWLFPGGGGVLPAVTGLPSQPSGSAGGKDHYVSAGVTRADGGAGRVPGRGVGAVEAFEPPTSTVTQATTPGLASDHSFREGASRRVASAASAKSDVYANADGSFTRRVYQTPVNFLDGDGSWRPIDRSLSPAGDGRLRQRAAGEDVSFAPDAVDAALAAVRLDAGHALSYGLQGAGGPGVWCPVTRWCTGVCSPGWTCGCRPRRVG